MALFTKNNNTDRKPAIVPPSACNGEWYYEEDSQGNHWYLNYLNQMVADGRLVIGNGGVNKINFDMRAAYDKALAAELCAPFARVIKKCGDMAANGRFYVVDEKGDEAKRYDKIRALLANPNPMQTSRNFIKSAEKAIRTFGYCPMYAPRGTANALPSMMSVIPPTMFFIEASGERFALTKEEAIKSAYIDDGYRKIILDPEDYFVINDGELIIPTNPGDKIGFSTSIDSLSHSVNNWMSQIIARGNLIRRGGPKGIVYSPDDKSGTGNAVMTGTEKRTMQNWFRARFGLVGKDQEPILVTNKNVGWIPLTFKVADLMLHEEDTACQNEIANTIGLNPNVFTSDSTYSNQRDAKKSAYEDLIIPDADQITAALTTALITDGGRIYLDYSHLSCMQEDRNLQSQSIFRVSSAMTNLIAANVISTEEARTELANYIDIDPTKIPNT